MGLTDRLVGELDRAIWQVSTSSTKDLFVTTPGGVLYSISNRKSHRLSALSGTGIQPLGKDLLLVQRDGYIQLYRRKTLKPIERLSNQKLLGQRGTEIIATRGNGRVRFFRRSKSRNGLYFVGRAISVPQSAEILDWSPSPRRVVLKVNGRLEVRSEDSTTIYKSPLGLRGAAFGNGRLFVTDEHGNLSNASVKSAPVLITRFPEVSQMVYSKNHAALLLPSGDVLYAVGKSNEPVLRSRSFGTDITSITSRGESVFVSTLGGGVYEINFPSRKF